jgi:guanosine-3',5'-bis(diphosphate) 3'-pyrophosphohydrolase
MNLQLWSQDEYTRAWRLACDAHNGQCMPGSDLPYVNHVANVAREVMTEIAHDPDQYNANLAVLCALLHDTIEDTSITYDDLLKSFGIQVADGVAALSKNKDINSKEQRMLDSLTRIKQQPKEVWLVKLADRIVNLQPPPKTWGNDKKLKYHAEAKLILNQLDEASERLGLRLRDKIAAYKSYIQ